MNHTAKFLSLALAAGLAVGMASCRRSDKPVFPITGKVFFKGKPAEGAQVTFVSLTDNDPKKPKPGGEVDPDGTFRLSTYASYDGAPAGQLRRSDRLSLAGSKDRRRERRPRLAPGPLRRSQNHAA